MSLVAERVKPGHEYATPRTAHWRADWRAGRLGRMTMRFGRSFTS